MSEHDLGVFSGPFWLRDLAAAAYSSNTCMRYGCTTCGAMPLRRALLLSAESAQGMEIGPLHESNDLGTLARRLGARTVVDELVMQIRALDTSAGELVSFLLQHLFNAGSEDFYIILERSLEGTPAGERLAQMKAHAAYVAERRNRNEEFNSPGADQKRRAAKAAAKQEEAAKRARKKARSDAARGNDQPYTQVRRIKGLQHVVVPKDYEFRHDSVLVRKVGGDLIISPIPDVGEPE